MTLVVDASTLAAIVMPDEEWPAAAGRLERENELIAPVLLWAEIRNILMMSERRGRVNRDQVAEAVVIAEAMKIALDSAPSSATVMDLARRHRLTVYDALYLELAQRRGAALATLDDALAAAARAEGVAVA